MGRAPCCDKANVKKGPWSPEEDGKLKAYIEQHGTGGNWIALPQKIGLKRCGKSCRLRWLNYLRPNLRHGGFSQEEDNIICSLYISIGSRWSIIAAQLPGRTDNDIKNYWNTRLKKKLLGKQRKEARRSATLHKQQDQHQQQQQHQDHDHEAAMIMSSVGHDSSGHGVMMMMNPTPYWPHHLPPPCLTGPDQDQELIKNLLIKLGGRFSEEPNTTHLDQYAPIDTTDLASENHLYAGNNSNNDSTCYFPSPPPPYDDYMLENYPLNHHDLVYEQPLDHTCYGIHNTINVSSTATATGTSSSESSSNWGTTDHVSFPLMMTTTTVSGYEPANFHPQQQDNAIFQDSTYFGLQ